MLPLMALWYMPCIVSKVTTALMVKPKWAVRAL